MKAKEERCLRFLNSLGNGKTIYQITEENLEIEEYLKRLEEEAQRINKGNLKRQNKDILRVKSNRYINEQQFSKLNKTSQKFRRN